MTHGFGQLQQSAVQNFDGRIVSIDCVNVGRETIMSVFPALRVAHRKLLSCFTQNACAISTTAVRRNQEQAATFVPCQDCIDTSDKQTDDEIRGSFFVYRNFISEEEEKSLFDEVEPYLKRLHYEKDHWDDAIHGYRETERKQWTKKNDKILQRVRDLAFPPGTPQLAYVHVLDLEKTGCIKAHIDSVKFCGSTIAGLCLLSSSVMRLVHDKDKTRKADILAERRALYIMTEKSRYDYSHEILGEEASFFRGQPVIRDRRISVICRNKPE